MPDAEPLVRFPVPSTAALIVIGTVLFLMLATAVGMEVTRRARRRRQRIASDWRAVMDIIRERELSPSEAETLTSLLRRRSPLEPLRAVTVRHAFDECMASEMAELRGTVPEKEFARVGAQLRDIRTQLTLDYIPFGQQIGSTRELHSGQWVSLSRPAENAWSRMLVDDVDEAYIFVSPHAKPGETIPRFRKGEEIRCRLWRDEDARYIFTTTIAEFDDPPPSWRLFHAERLTRMQARDHFRVRYDQGTSIGVLNASVDGNEANLPDRREVTRLRGRITSLSAGGCALVVQQEVAKQVLLRIRLEIEGEEPIPLEARIVSTAPISGGRVLIRAAFVGLDEERRDRVAKYVLKRQQHMLAAREAAH